MALPDTILTPAGNSAELMAFLGSGAVKITEADLTVALSVGVGEVEKACGPIVSRNLTERIAGGSRVVVEGGRCSVVVSLTPDAGGSAPASYIIDGQVIASGDGSDLPAGVIVYTSGFCSTTTTPPWWAKAAALHIARHYWRTQLSNSKAPTIGDGSSYLIPNQAASLMDGYTLAPDGFA